MIEKFRERVEVAGGSAIVDIVQWLNFLTFDISGALAFGEPFDSVKNGKAHPWVAISCGFGKGIALMASIKFFSPLDKLLELAMPKNVLQKMQYHQDLARQKCLQRISMHDEKASTQDYVGSILQYNKEKGEVIPREEIVMNMGLLIFAGAETTSSALSSIIRQLVRNPEALKKAQVEIRGAFKTESDITVGNVAKLTYLNAVIQEGIRLGPPAAVGIPRVVPKEGASVCGRWVPGGVSCCSPRPLL
jgi:cytochrome P450